MKPTHFDKLESIVKSEEDLVNFVRELQGKEESQLKIYILFNRYYRFLLEEEREHDSDTICDVLERIYGWCSEEYKLFERNLTNEEILNYENKT